MMEIFQVVTSPYIVAIVAAWLIAHIIKSFTSKKGAEADFTKLLFMSGGMPSSHAATSLAVWTVVLIREGAESGLFGIATLFALIVCYDAVKVRRSSGEQGAAIQTLIKETKSKAISPRSAKGHTPIEVAAGGVLGITIGIIVAFFIT